MAKVNVYEIITNQIIADLENGITPWECPWFGSLANAATGHQYRGMNQILLGAAMAKHGYGSPLFLTFKQAKALGGHIRKGEKSHIVTFFRFVEKKIDVDGEKRKDGSDRAKQRIPVLRYYRVFNIEQTEGIDPAKLDTVHPLLSPEARVEHADHFIEATGAEITFSAEPRAYYAPARDAIHLPHFETFKTARGFYSTALHELAHWTGHESRLARDLDGRFGNESYAAEELIAEIGAAFTMAHLGFEYESQHSSYIASWLRVLKNDHYAIFTAAREAQRLSDFLLELTGLKEKEDAEEAAAE